MGQRVSIGNRLPRRWEHSALPFMRRLEHETDAQYLERLVTAIDERMDEFARVVNNNETLLGVGGGGSGAAGAPGPPGMDGAEGDPGPPGPPGPAGSGATGAQGPAGSMGPPGGDGADGEDGIPGAVGPQGATGAQGPQGLRGADGAPGLDGVDGVDGDIGPAGPQGAQGASGPQGPPGPPGPEGAEGPEGPQGPKGDTGPQGPAGGGGGGSATTVERDLGSSPVWTGTFTITDAGITSTSKVFCWQEIGPYTGKGNRADEAEMDQLDCIAYPATGSASVRWRVRGTEMPVWPRGQGNTTRSGINPLNTPQDDPQARMTSKVIGRVRGNFRFSYSVYA